VLSIQIRNRALSAEDAFVEDARVDAALRLLPALAIPVAIGLWQWSLHGIDLRRMNDLGLASVVGPGFLAALVVLTLSMTVALLRPRPSTPALLCHVLALILILYGSIPLLDTVPQGTAVYNHLGVADYISHHGSVDRTIDAYFNWPGFFVLVSSLTSVLGARSALAVARWGPLYFNLLFLVPLVLFFRVSSRSVAYTWLCIWLFFCCNWVAQDAFSPQAFAFLAYLCIVALVLNVFRWRDDDGKPIFDGVQRASIFVVIVLAYVAVAISHQLTPYALIFAIGALVVTRATKLYALPIFMAVVAVTWFAYSAVPFFELFLRIQGRNIGHVSENVNSGLGARLAGTPEHLFVVHTRVAFTLMLWALVPIGIFLRRRHGLPNKTFMALGASTIVLVGLQSYGGEILLRIYLFSLPPVLIFVSGIIFLSRTTVFQRGVLISSLSIAVLSLFLFARFGNARLDYFSPQELAAIDHLYTVAPPDSLLLAGTLNLPWRSQGYTSYDYQTVDSLGSWIRRPNSPRAAQLAADEVVRRMRSKRPAAFLVFARSMEPWESFRDRRREGELTAIRADLVRSGAVRPIYHNQDAVIYVLRRGAAG
jgi:hypothetical protein